MQTYLKTRPVWVQFFLFLGIAAVSFIIASAVGVLILSKMTGVSLMQLRDSKGWDMNNPGMLTFLRGMILIQFFFSLLCLPFFFLTSPTKDPFSTSV